MRCDHCGRDAMVFQRYSGHHLCGDHFTGDLEARAKRTIRAHGWIQPGDRIAIALSGGRSSGSLLPFLTEHFGMRRDITFVAITVNEGICSRREMDRIGRMAERAGVEWARSSFPEEFGSILHGIPAQGGGGFPCSSCVWLRGRALSSLARRAEATKLALGTNLDDGARSVFLRVLRGEAHRLMRSSRKDEGDIPRIRPFLYIPEGDLSLYARLKGIGHAGEKCPGAPDPLESEAGRILANYSLRHPEALFSLVHLGEALSARGDSGGGESRLAGRCGELSPSACPAREIHDRVTGHG